MKLSIYTPLVLPLCFSHVNISAYSNLPFLHKLQSENKYFANDCVKSKQSKLEMFAHRTTVENAHGQGQIEPRTKTPLPTSDN